MKLLIALVVINFLVGLTLLSSWLISRRRREWRVIAAHIGAVVPQDPVQMALARTIAWLTAHKWGMPWGSDQELERLSRCSGDRSTLASLRLRQLRTGIVMMLVVAGWAILRALTHPGASPIPAVALLLAAVPLGGWIVRERLARAATRRGDAMSLQLPTVLDLLAFSVAAGESTTAALRRVAHTVRGPLGAEIERATVDIANGVTFAVALRSVAQASRSTGVERAMRAIEVAVERGTPLAEVLRAQAADARTEQMRHLLTIAGRKETTMMLPVVFLVLPMIVIVAVLPATVSMHMF